MLCLISTILTLAGKPGKQHLSDLLIRVAQNDSDALSELYSLTKTSVYGLALSYLKSAHDAQDITQDTFVRILNNADKFHPTGSALSWILTICRNLCLMKLRSEGEILLEEDEWNAVPDDSDALTFEEKHMLSVALKALDETERRIVILHATTGLKHREIASQLDIPLPTVLSKYSRAIKKLRKILEGDEK